jgi:hypothetical protein
MGTPQDCIVLNAVGMADHADRRASEYRRRVAKFVDMAQL